MSTESFSVETRDGIAHLRLTRPEVANALGKEFWSEFATAVHALDRAGGVRAMVLSGEGRHFCSGMELTAFSPETVGTDTPLDREAFSHMLRDLQRTISAVEDARFPVIAAVHGACVGGGLDLVSACDLRVAAEDTRFRIEEINIGMMADIGSLQRLPKLMPEGVVKELAFTGRTLDAARAAAVGFVSEVHPSAAATLEAALSIARAIAGKSPLAIAGSKSAIKYARDHSVSESLEWAVERQAGIWNMPEIMEAMRARMAKENGTFSDLHPMKKLGTQTN